MVMYRNNIWLHILAIAFMGLAQPIVSQLENKEAVAINAGGDAQRLISHLSTKLKEASKRQISRMEQSSGESFKPSKTFNSAATRSAYSS